MPVIFERVVDVLGVGVIVVVSRVIPDPGDTPHCGRVSHTVAVESADDGRVENELFRGLLVYRSGLLFG